MDNSYKNEGFSNIKIKSSVARKFKVFVRKYNEFNSTILDKMLGFFERHLLFIAILKDMEKTQTKPTVGMLEALFTLGEKEEEAPLFVEKKQKQ